MSINQKNEKHLHIYFFPLLAPSHMILLVDMARLFARHDPTVKSTIVLPHSSLPQYLPTIELDRRLLGSNIHILELPSPDTNIAVLDHSASLDPPHLHPDSLSSDPPDCIVSDFFISYTADLASHLHVPRIAVHVTGFFPLCVHHNLLLHNPHPPFHSHPDSPFLIPGLPHPIHTTYRQLAHFLLPSDNNPIMDRAKKAALSSLGVIFNTFRELEPAYVDYYKTNIGSKAWHVGPISLCNPRGGGDGGDCLEWLDGRRRDSVVYVCFGTMSTFQAEQIEEIALGLETCGHDFMWVVKEVEKLPEGYEERVEGRGVVVRKWVPQVRILEHEAVGGFLTHCGWSSFMEGVAAGKPMIGWPISAEHFENEKLVSEVLGIGVGVGCVEWSERLDVKRIVIRGERIGEAVREVMGSGEMRRRAVELSGKARKAVEKGGSSYDDLDGLLDELRSIKDTKNGV